MAEHLLMEVRFEASAEVTPAPTSTITRSTEHDDAAACGDDKE